MRRNLFSFLCFALLQILPIQNIVCINLNNRNQPRKRNSELYHASNGSRFFTTAFDNKMYSTGKKWQLGRVSRKQYEIINMLWRKSNVFADVSVPLRRHDKTSTETSATVLSLVPKLQLSTMSAIEFYYLEEYLDSLTAKTNKTDATSDMKTVLNKSGKLLQRSPFFAFLLQNDPLKPNKPLEETLKRDAKMNSVKTGKFIERPPSFLFNVDGKLVTHKRHLCRTKSYKISATPQSRVCNSTVVYHHILARNLPDYTVPYRKTRTTNTPSDKEESTNKYISSSKTTTTSSESVNSTKSYDKIKFFEIYDSYTHGPEKQVPQEDDSKFLNNGINNSKEINLKNFDKEVHTSPNKIKHTKQHIKSLNIAEDTVTTTSASGSVTYIDMGPAETMEYSPWDLSLRSNSSRPVSWTKYPFVAAYVYERFQVHCDAATISQHWLIASASCLARHREDLHGEGRSAFVTFCSEKWWNVERITYVKYTLLHPRFNPHDVSRRNQYNIGVIQVVASMSLSCPNWIPVSFMSHQYVSELEGSFGSAVGFGLDRYDISYASSDLPRHPLSVYDSLIYSNTCPGSKYISTSQEFSLEEVKNLYCLSLPPYSGENHDPVHGGLLLVGGKLLALYLQEERHRWGDQSAQYTGVWRLIPWLNEVAKEPEEIDFKFQFIG